jgi:hypothetical protein
MNERDLASDDGADHVRDHLRAVAPVAIKKEKNVAVGVHGLDPALDRKAVTAPQFDNNARPRAASTLRRPIPGAAVNDDHLI